MDPQLSVLLVETVLVGVAIDRDCELVCTLVPLACALFHLLEHRENRLDLLCEDLVFRILLLHAFTTSAIFVLGSWKVNLKLGTLESSVLNLCLSNLSFPAYSSAALQSLVDT
jgi:hypothetical protein